MPLMLDNPMETTTHDGDQVMNHDAISAGDIPMNGPMQVDGLDVDDLFGDGVNLTLPNVRGPSRQLAQRVDEMRTRGCAQGIAWSKSGTIAYISPDGRSVQVRYLRADPKTGGWGLSEPTTVDAITASPSTPIVHLAWAATSSNELAVIDAAGRVAILAFSVSLNRPFLTRKWDADHVDDLHAIAGCFWLPLASQHKNYHVFHGPAVKDATAYRYESSFIHAFGPWHPNPAKSALLCVTTSGMLRLFWSQSNNKLEETTLELDSFSSSDDLITHASLHSDKNHMYVALATASRQLRLVRPLNPTMTAKHLAISSWMPNGQSGNPIDASMTQISHIELLPSQLDNTGHNWVPMNVLVVRSYLPTADSPFQEMQSVIDRWEVGHEPSPALHPAFEQMGSRRNSSAGGNDKDPNRLKRLDPVFINKVIVGMQTIHFGKAVCVAFSDGSVEYRDRFTMQETYNELSLDRVMTLNQVGFTFAEGTPCLQVAFSPTNCSVAQIQEDGQVKWNGLHYPLGDIGNSNQDVRCSHRGSHSSRISCNVLPAFTRDWVNELVRMLKVPVDYSEEAHHEALVRNSSLQLCFSILNHLGFNGEFNPRSSSGKFAFLSLNIRNVVILITIASNTPTNMREKLNPLDEHEVIDALCGCAQWSVDLLAYLADSLFALLDDPKFTELLQPRNYSEISNYLRSRADPSLQLLLCSATRGFLSAVCRRLTHLDQISHRAIEFYDRRAAMQNATDPSGQSKVATIALNKSYQRMQHIISNSHIKVQDFDHLLTTLTSDIRSTYQTAFAGLAAQAQQKNESNGTANTQQGQKQIDAQIRGAQIISELNLLLAAQPPAPFLTVLKKLFGQDLRAFRAQTDPSKLFFADLGLLEVDDVPRVLGARRAAARYVDVFRRVEMTNKAGPKEETPEEQLQQRGGRGGPLQWRRCVRCAAVMEDVFGSRPGFTFVLTQQRKCSCGGYWALLPKASIA
ncbi:mediator of RNA polymerase II transcription subunit 16 [Verticillium alfalfae VaMs.102]|uniref:Mediator of RNA polymerase II transcription subunit 16 n=1 Tax=Verticillium alfalfae (strain VaMs.102 / ATCC MYA-4576 / FGSC 10136) TaxID=526221 RepID=C9SJH4_VERA1|nr:mediator of RNA polymerase II transcription subunit 16 [Verticillium alfalfae VaMs.102]EEY18336.1 mediator of RNA polymerase II transcription subunit 16 [Verticillium alfalfae VaMs.102]